MESVNLISNDQYLMKFKGSDLSGIQDYWTIIDKYGQIKELPQKAKDLLIWSNFSDRNVPYLNLLQNSLLCYCFVTK